VTLTRYHVYAVLFIAASLLGAAAVISYRQMASRVETLEATAQEYDELKKSVDELKAEVARRRVSDQAIRDSRSNTTKAIQEAARADTAVADFISAPLPDGLRAAYLKAHDASRVAPTDNH
jgi:cell division protein FtsB